IGLILQRMKKLSQILIRLIHDWKNYSFYSIKKIKRSSQYRLLKERCTIMAVRKRRKSKKVTRQGRSHKKVSATGLVECSSCGEYTKPYHVCKSCGQYDSKQVVDQI